ncbi:VanZ family protein [Gottfriedia sp. NPDC057948]|uniref:VanZ family protein n=1 Tax=Gottfriedia sp. NPDC057948 TaxID=3346287 RepID=UPI0036DAFFB7
MIKQVYMNKNLNTLFTIVFSTIIVLILMRAFLGDLLSRIFPYANLTFGYSIFVLLVLLVNTLINIVQSCIKGREMYISKLGFGVFTLSYIVVIYSILFSRNSLGNHYTSNYLPFKTILSYLKSEADYIYILSNLIGNIVIFIPLGYIVYFYFNRKIKGANCLLLSLVLIIILEYLQKIFVVGSLDVDDLILNFIGVLIGIRLLVKIISIKTSISR